MKKSIKNLKSCQKKPRLIRKQNTYNHICSFLKRLQRTYGVIDEFWKPFLLKPQIPETSGQMKIEGIHRAPGRPVGVGGRIAAFIEVRPPDIPLVRPQGAGVWPQNIKRDPENELPGPGFRHLRIDHRGHGRPYADAAPLFRGQRLPGLESRLRAGGVGNVGGQQGPAAVELEIEIPPVRTGLHEEFDTAVFIDRRLKMGMHAADIAVFHREGAPEGRVVPQQFGNGARPVVAAFRPETIHVKVRCPPPVIACPRGMPIDIAIHTSHRIAIPGRWCCWRLVCHGMSPLPVVILSTRLTPSSPVGSGFG